MPFAFRSACSCNIRMAFGCTGFEPAPPPTGLVGGLRPRAKPRFSHSVVMPTHAPAAFRYSTRNQPSIKFQGPAPHGDPVGGPTQPPSPSPVAAIAILVLPGVPTTGPTNLPCGDATHPPAVKSMS